MHIYGRQLLIAAAALAAGLGAAPASADVKTGVEAWQAGNYVGAVREWRALADKGDSDAQFNMGQAYKLGRGVPADLKIAQSWYQKAAAKGHEQAQANLGLILFQEGNRAGALPWLRKAADRGDPRAQYVLGTALFNGDLIAKDWPRAYALMTRAAAQGLPQAATSLTQMDQFIPLTDRQKGVALARRMETGANAPASAAAKPAPVVKAARVAGSALPTAKPTPAAKPAATAAATPKPANAARPVATAAAMPKPAPAAKPALAAKTAAAAPAVKVTPGGKWRVQLGAYNNRQAAEARWAVLSKKVSGLSGMQPSYEKAGAFTRLRVGPVGDRATAAKLCASATAAGQACFPVSQ